MNLSALPMERLQVLHYAAVRARLFGPQRRQFVPVPRREWYTPQIIEVTLEGRIASILAALHTPITAHIVIRATAAAFDIPASAITSHSRSAGFVEPRHVAMAICRIHLAGTKRGTLPSIGRAFGGRDHTTVLHGARKYEAIVERIAQSLAEPR